MADVETVEKTAYEALNNKQRAFVDTYLSNGFNATRAAVKVGYSPKTAYAIASENLRKLEIKAAISERMAEIAMDANEVMGRLAAIARGDIADVRDLEFATANGTSFLIKSYSTSAMGGERLEIYSAMDALQLIGKHHKLFVERHEHTGADGKPIEFNSTVAVLAEQELDEWRKQQLVKISNTPSA